MFSAKAILFDLDGTLVDSFPDIANSANLMLDKLGLPRASDHELGLWVGNGAPKLVKRALTGDVDGEPNDELLAQALPLFYDLYEQNLWQHSMLYSGVIETLERFLARGFSMACVTNKPIRHTLLLLEQTGLSRFFRYTIGGDSLPKRKPEPDQLMHAAALMNLKASDCVMVGDSVNDIVAAQAATMPVLCLTYGYNQGADLAASAPDVLVDRFSDLADLITNDN